MKSENQPIMYYLSKTFSRDELIFSHLIDNTKRGFRLTTRNVQFRF